MEVKKTNLPQIGLINILKEMNSEDLDVVSHDTLHFKCNHCHGCLPFGSNGIMEICNKLNKDIGSVLKDLIKSFIEIHYHQGNICKGSMEVDETKTPAHLLLVFQESDLKYLTDFSFSDRISLDPLLIFYHISFLYLKTNTNTEIWVTFSPDQ